MTKPKSIPAATRAKTRSFPRVGAIVSAAIILVAGAAWWNSASRTQPPPAGTPTEVTVSTNLSAAHAPLNPALQKIRGKWLRPDGGYIVEVREIQSDGELKVAYFNPRPIHVAKAKAVQEGTELKVFIELQDVNYPGCTYDLVYEVAKDQLTGVYYQAALQQRFDVIFERAQ